MDSQYKVNIAGTVYYITGRSERLGDLSNMMWELSIPDNNSRALGYLTNLDGTNYRLVTFGDHGQQISREYTKDQIEFL